MLFRDNINQMKFLGDGTFVLKVDTKYLKNEICFKVISATLFTASPIKSVVCITIFSPPVLVLMNVTMTLQIFLLIIKYFCQDPPSPEEPQLCDRSCGRHRCRVLLRHPGVPHRRGPRVGRQRLQGSQGEEDHPQASPAGHQRYVVTNIIFPHIIHKRFLLSTSL